MKNKLIISIIAVITAVILITCCSCNSKKNKTGINILEQPEDYTGEFDVPSSKKVEEGSALSVISNINEEVFEIQSATKTKSDDPTVIECYRINCYGVNIELFKYTDESQRLKEVRESGKFIVRSSDGTVLKEFDAVANGNYVLMFSSSTDTQGNDLKEKNQQIIDQFEKLILK